MCIFIQKLHISLFITHFKKVKNNKIQEYENIGILEFLSSSENSSINGYDFRNGIKYTHILRESQN